MKYIALILCLLSVRANAVLVTITLDFDGNPPEIWDNKLIPATPAFTGDVAAVTARVVENFKPFNVAIALGSQPGMQGRSIHVIVGGSGDWFPSGSGVTREAEFYEEGPTIFVFSQDLLNRTDYVANCITHELGHAAGLEHQSIFQVISGMLVKTAEYAPGYFMGDIFSADLVWGVGRASTGVIQDDVAILDARYGVNADEVITPDLPEPIWGTVAALGVWLLGRRRTKRYLSTTHGSPALSTTTDIRGVRGQTGWFSRWSSVIAQAIVLSIRVSLHPWLRPTSKMLRKLGSTATNWPSITSQSNSPWKSCSIWALVWSFMPALYPTSPSRLCSNSYQRKV